MDPSILLLIVTVGLLIMLTTGRRRQRREQQAVQSRLEPGRAVMTSSGLYATVVSVEDAVVVLETGPGQQSRWDRRSVVQVITDADITDADQGGDAEMDDSEDLAEPDEPASSGGRDPVSGDAPGDPPPRQR